ncbi:MAG TPA: prolyl oligopeptidase family serine peptidase [Lacipirellulaceae bacterium]|nr:prolyl oligopeptidase family serine peptidase [Lacipirellulaceae bacterium]
MRFSSLVCLVALHGSSLALGQAMTYPQTRRAEQVDVYHGHEVADPYRWLEDDARTSQEVADWIAAQNEVTAAFLAGIPERDAFRERLAELWNFERYSTPWRRGDRYFYYKNDGLQNQPVLYHAPSYDGEGVVLIDPNQWSADGTVALGQAAVSEDGRLVAYTRQDAGSDWVTIHVMEVESGRELGDVLQWSRHGNVVWNGAGDGFFYARYPEPPPGQQHQALALGQMIYFHSLGTPQADDQLVYRDPEHPEYINALTRTDDDRYLVLSIYRSTDPQNKVLVRRVDAPLDAPWTALIDDFDNEFGFIGNEGSRLLLVTDLDAPTKRVVALDAEQPGRDAIAEVIPAQEATLEGASLLDDKLVCQYLEDVASRVELFDAAGRPLQQVALPGVGSASGFGGRQTDVETFFSFTSYTTPTSIYRLDLRTLDAQRIRQPRIDFDPWQFTSRLEFFASKDGTRIPIVITHRKDVTPNGDNPTLLYAYGGFNISITPAFSVEYALWMEHGGVLAVANLRGWGEYGEAWHQAGKKANKQNVFDDFIAAAEWLVDQRYTNPQRLAIMGGSNGGLLVGAVMTQRPELFAAAIPAVGVLDMLRFHKFTAGLFWVDEYGSADDPAEFAVLRAYSPYHNVRPGVAYPATMITTADTDDRVVPMHSFKFGAALQEAHRGATPILLRIETRAGHGAGKPISKRIDEAADRWAFLWKALGMSAGD